MSRHIQLSIDDPCHENWENMSPADKGRFCAACQKQVVDFTGMSDSQIVALLKKPSTGSMCGRFFPDQLHRDLEIPKKHIPWIKYFFQFTLPAFLLSMKATAQDKTKAIEKNIRLLPEASDTSRNEVPLTGMFAPWPAGMKKDSLLTGKIIDENGSPVWYATVAIKGTKIATIADSAGNFTIMPPQELKYVTLQISCVGYESHEMRVRNDQKAVSVTMQIKLQTLTMGVIVTTKSHKKKENKSTPVYTQKLMDTAFKYFKVFPNPVNSGASLHIEWKKTEEGYYTLDLIDISGKTIHTREIWIDAEARLLNLEIPSVTPGNYFLRVTHKETGKSNTEKIIIQ